MSDATLQLNNNQFTDAVSNVQQYLYGRKTTDAPWNGDELLKVIQQVNATGINTSTKTDIALNPS